MRPEHGDPGADGEPAVRLRLPGDRQRRPGDPRRRRGRRPHRRLRQHVRMPLRRQRHQVSQMQAVSMCDLGCPILRNLQVN